MLLKNSIILLLILTTSILSQQIGVWKNYTNMDNVMNISSTSDGFWIATTGGAGYFLNSSNEFELFLTNSEGLNSQNITASGTDSKYRVWLGMQNGMIDIYNPNDESTIPIKDIFDSPNSSKEITDILIVDTVAYVTTEFGLSLISSDNLDFISTTTKFNNFPSKTVVNSVNVDGKIYVSTAIGVAIQKDGATNLIAPESWDTYQTGIDIVANTVYATIKYNNELIAATDKGLFSFDGTTWNSYATYSTPVLDLGLLNNKLIVLLDKSLNSYDGINDKIIYSTTDKSLRKLEVTKDEIFLIASNMGTVKINNNNSEVLLPNGPINNSFESLAVDKNGALWVGTGKDVFGEGFMKFEKNFWTNYNTDTMPELPNNNYHNVSADDYQVYLSNWGRGLTIEEDGAFSYFNASNSELVGIPGSPNYVVIMNAQRDNNGDLWFFNHASNDGKPIIQLTTDSTWYHYRFPFTPITVDNYIIDGVIDEYNTKWFNVVGRGVYYLNEQSTPADASDDIWGHLTAAPSRLNANTVNTLAIDKRGELWIGTTSGMNILANTASPKSSITSVFTLRQQSITAIAVDPLNNKWVGTYQGLFVMSPDGSQLIAQYDINNSPLSSNSITSLAIDKKSGLIYIGTSFGLSTLTTYSAEPKQEFDEIITYPSPFRIGTHEYVTIDGLVKNSTIKILSISGRLIKELETPGGRITFWDGKDENGKFVSSGIYLIVAFDEEADKITTSKLAVIR